MNIPDEGCPRNDIDIFILITNLNTDVNSLNDTSPQVSLISAYIYPWWGFQKTIHKNSLIKQDSHDIVEQLLKITINNNKLSKAYKLFGFPILLLWVYMKLITLSVPDEAYYFECTWWNLLLWVYLMELITLSVPDEAYYFECTWWSLFKKHAMHTKSDSYVFVTL